MGEIFFMHTAMYNEISISHFLSPMNLSTYNFRTLSFSKKSQYLIAAEQSSHLEYFKASESQTYYSVYCFPCYMMLCLQFFSNALGKQKKKNNIPF